MEKKESPSVKGRGNEKWQLCDEKKKKVILRGIQVLVKYWGKAHQILKRRLHMLKIVHLG